MAHPYRAHIWLNALIFLWIATGITAFGSPIQNSESKIANFRRKALVVPLQTPVEVDLRIVRDGKSPLFSGRLTEVGENSIKVLVCTGAKLETREVLYSDIESIQFQYISERSIHTLQNRLLRAPEGSLIELRLKNRQKMTGVVDEHLEESIVFRYRADVSLDRKEIPISEVKSFSVKSYATSTVKSDPHAFDLLWGKSSGQRPEQEDSDATIPVVLRLIHTISTVDALAGDPVDFEILADVKIGNQITIAKGGRAWGKVIAVKPKKWAGRGAQIQLTVESARTSAGEVLALSAVQNVKGSLNTSSVAVGAAVAGFVFVPLAPLGLMSHGTDTAIPKGTMFIAYLNPDSIRK